MDILSPKSIDEVVSEITRIHKSLPERPGIEEIEAAKSLILNVEADDKSRFEAIGRQIKNPQVPDELFLIFQEMQKNLVIFRSKEQKREAIKLLDLENFHQVFDEMIQRASSCLNAPMGSNDSVSSSSLSNLGTFEGTSSTTTGSSSLFYERDAVKVSTELFTRDDSYVKKAKSTFSSDGVGGVPRSGGVLTPQIVDSSLKAVITSGQGEKMSLIKLASLIEVSAKKKTHELNLQGKLMEQIEWLPDSLGKLSSLITLDLSENKIAALPSTIGGLSSLTKLDLHSNKLVELPETVGDILSLVSLDLRGNQLTSLPATFGRLVRLQDLDLSSNLLPLLPESIGSLVSLKTLNIETNNIEELPHTIAHCSSLKVLRADYNRLKALPEAVGRIASLEVLTVRYNNISRLPTTMASLENLKELDISFNEVGSVPESLCFATTLVKMDISNNFADLQYLPRSIGNLEMLEELNMCNNQIRILPDSFAMLSKLRVLNVEGNPLEEPPRSVTDMGAQAVVQYMAEFVAKRNVKVVPVKQKKSWASMCFFSNSNKRKRSGMDYVKT
ncbi:plant intracellular Ras-group-related LRR protein 4-like [Heracleum sosnowskyi]|uniref:Plant intracellular Ras-group-related LRR protein 4-like n=1 Tax=Heracleum sosnowskyi TaxID=360622 RepID=A0AAD8IEP6_9APIA|nr:plant intracellular Ras-group-related LRR protein 4-like [Heracleum sosnowskyi]